LLVNNPADVASNIARTEVSIVHPASSTEWVLAIEVTLFFFPLFNVIVRETVFSTTTLLIGCQLEVRKKLKRSPVGSGNDGSVAGLFQREHVAAIQPVSSAASSVAIVSKEHAAKFASFTRRCKACRFLFVSQDCAHVTVRIS